MSNTQLDIRRLSSRQGDFAERFRQLGHTQVETGAEIERAVRDIIDDVRQRGSNLIVMGGYGHSRMREFVLGGATRHILHNMTIPVLMSH